MPPVDPEALLTMLRDPNSETQEIASAAVVSREEAGRACRLVMSIGKAKPDEILKLPSPLAMAVLRAAARAGRADILAAAAVHPHRDVAKEAKRALYLLKARGVAVPEPARPPPAVAPVPAAEPPVPCYASTVDGHGERALWLGRVVPGKGIEVAQVVFSDQKGLTELHLGVLGRKEYRMFGKDLLERGRTMGVGEIDREQAKGLVSAARRLNEPSGTPVPEGADAWLSRLGPESAAPDPSLRFPPLPGEEEHAAVEASGLVHALPLVRGWLADEDLLRALARRLDEISVSQLYLDEAQRAEAAAQAIADAVVNEFDDRRRALWSSRLFVIADHLDRSGDAENARRAAAAARALRSGADASRIPFARLLVEKAFPPPRSGAPPDEPAPSHGPLIVTPSR